MGSSLGRDDRQIVAIRLREAGVLEPPPEKILLGAALGHSTSFCAGGEGVAGDPSLTHEVAAAATQGPS